ncbi:MAG: serine/threonine protein kinase, partial [Planctomycetota bacterium]
MPTHPLQQDSALARYLHNERVLPLPVLNELVQECRRSGGSVRLADLLVRRGHMSRDEVEARLSCISGLGAEPVKLTESAEWRVPVTQWRRDGRIDGYRLIDRLGKGCMGSVYLCEDVRTGARLAMKTVKLSAAPTLVERLRREGQAQAKVDGHPNVVRIHGQGQAHGRCYLVMEYCPGGDLARRLRERGPLPPCEAAALVRDLARGLAHMHAQGVVHRDLKPANVLFGEDGQPKLADFGLASFEQAMNLTQAGDLVGTPLYMAPEQARGHHEGVGPACDVYALGAILYQAMTGRVPFPGDTTVEVLERLRNEEPPRPRQLRPEVPRALEAVCLQALSKRPDARPDAVGFAAALDAVLAGGASPAGRSALPGWVAVLAGTSLALLVAGGALLLGENGGRRQHAALASSPTGSPSPGPAVEPARSAGLAPLAWNLRPGERLHVDLRLTVERDWSDRALQFERSYAMEWEVLAATPAAVRVRATVAEFVARVGARGELLDFDSRRAENADERLRRLIGASFRFSMHPGTGEVLATDDLTRLQNALFEGLESEGERRRFYVPELRGREWGDVLQTCLYVLPGVEVREGDRWVRSRPPFWTLAKERGGGPGVVEATFRLRRRTAEGVRNSWSGAG